MSTRTRSIAAMAAALAAAVALAAPTTPASARPLTGGPVLAPTAPRPTAAPPPPPAGSSRLAGFAVTADSVVATATVGSAGPATDLTVSWGDGTVSRPSPLPVTSTRAPAPPPDGTFVFHHTYAAPADGSTFTRTVSASVPGEARTAVVTVTPRYRVTQYTALFGPLRHCDTTPEIWTEWTVFQEAPSGAERHWDLTLETYYLTITDGRFHRPDFHPLPGSAVAMDLTAGQAPRVRYHAVEHDLIVDDELGDVAVNLDPRLGSRRLNLDMIGGDPLNPGTCLAEIIADVDVRLLAPGADSGPVAAP
jgi:hypothetical protein